MNHTQMSQNPDRYLVVGNPVSHSRSPEIHRAFADQFDDDIHYDKIEVPLDGFARFVTEFGRSGGCGLNVTVPFKLEAFDYADPCDELAESAAAVNTLRFTAQGQCEGFNTDGIGLLNDLYNRHSLDLENKTVLILGAGGATQGVLAPLLQTRPARLMIANRTVDKAQQMFARYLARMGPVPDTEVCVLGFDELRVKPDLIINATSVGLNGNAELIDPSWVRNVFCYDMSYGKAASFCAWAARHGARASVDGLGMLVEQAAQSYFLWRGKRPQTDPVVAQLRRTLNA